MQADYRPRAVRALTVEFKVTYCVIRFRLRLLRWSRSLSLPWLRVSWVSRPVVSDLPRLEENLRACKIALGDEIDLRGELAGRTVPKGHAD